MQAQAQNLMHWTAVGFGLGIAAYFGMFHEPGALVFLASSLVAGLSVSLAVRFRDGIARFLIVIAAVAAGFAWCQYRAHAVFGPVLSDRFYGAVQGRVIGIDRSLSERPRLTLDELVLETVSRQATPRRIRMARGFSMSQKARGLWRAVGLKMTDAPSLSARRMGICRLG